jgi:iron(III) transport system substrate-binding protein
VQPRSPKAHEINDRTTMPSRAIARLIAAAAVALLAARAHAVTINLYCSSPNTAWCQGMAVGFEKATGIHAVVLQKATGEMLAQVEAERANPRGDVWWAGPGDSYLQAAEHGLLETYRSPRINELYDWAQAITEVSKDRVSGVYGGIIALGYNTELAQHKHYALPKCWKDLADPAYKGDIMLGNPAASGTAYLMLATLVQVMGEDEAFKLMAAIHPNVTSYARSGIGPMTAVKQGEVFLGSTVLHGVINEIVRGYPVRPIMPCEGVGYEIGSVAIIKGTHHLDEAKRFVDYALSPEGNAVGLAVGEYAMPTNRAVALPPQVPNLADIKVIRYDFVRFGEAETRKHLIERWQREVEALPR